MGGLRHRQGQSFPGKLDRNRPFAQHPARTSGATSIFLTQEVVLSLIISRRAGGAVPGGGRAEAIRCP
jgi:hypothetical protein